MEELGTRIFIKFYYYKNMYSKRNILKPKSDVYERIHLKNLEIMTEYDQ